MRNNQTIVWELTKLDTFKVFITPKINKMNNNNVYWLLEMNIVPGQLKNMKILMAEMVTATKAKEPETLNYEWHLNADETQCTVFERYADSEAVMTHLTNFGEFAERLLSALQPTKFSIFGSASDQVKAALSAFGPVYMNAADGFAR